MEVLIGPLVIILIPFILALPALIPPVRNAAKRSPIARGGVAAVLAMTSFVVLYGMAIWIGTQIAMAIPTSMYLIKHPSEEVATLQLVQESARELWLRSAIPRPLRGSCVTTSYECEQADEFMMRVWGYDESGESPTRPGGLSVGAGLCAALINVVFVEIFTRPPKPAEPLTTSVRESAGQAIQD